MNFHMRDRWVRSDDENEIDRAWYKLTCGHRRSFLCETLSPTSLCVLSDSGREWNIFCHYYYYYYYWKSLKAPTGKTAQQGKRNFGMSIVVFVVVVVVI